LCCFGQTLGQVDLRRADVDQLLVPKHLRSGPALLGLVALAEVVDGLEAHVVALGLAQAQLLHLGVQVYHFELVQLQDAVVAVEHYVHAGGHLAEHDVLGRSGAVDKVQEVVVLGVDEEQGSAGLGLASVGHGEGADLVTELGTVRLVELIGDESLADINGGRCRSRSQPG